MGVPLVTLAGFTPVERQGHAFVNLIGRADWSVTDPGTYVKKAVALARDPNRLREMRFDQRSSIHQSKLSDAAAFVALLINFVRNY
jgi:predicted O-linked N-acetylglucosamine transferase (SPINDLY family)